MKETIASRFSEGLFWDVDPDELKDMDKYAMFIVQRVLEYGNMDDWRIIRSYYGLKKIIELGKQMRTLSAKALSFLCALSNTKKEEYRCWHFRQSNPTLWNS